MDLIRIEAEDKFELNGLTWQSEPKSKSLVIMVPGATTGAALVAMHDYYPMATALNSAGYDFLVSNMRASYNYPYSVYADCVKDIAGFVEYAKAQGYEQVAIAGISLGGPRMAQYMAERGDPVVKAVAFVASIPSPYEEYQIRHDDGGRQRLDDVLAKARECVANGNPLEPIGFENWFPDGRHFMVTAQGMLGFFGSPEDDAPSSIKYGARITVPALVLHGDSDELSLPPNAETIYNALTASSNPELIWVKGARHYLSPGKIADDFADALSAWVIKTMPV